MSGKTIAIVGAGPSGLFAAVELCRAGLGNKVAIFDKGKDLNSRACPAQGKQINCIKCKNCSITTGMGGAGTFSDGKITLSPGTGGSFEALGIMTKQKVQDELNKVMQDFCEFGATDKLYGSNNKKVTEIRNKALQAGLDFVPSIIQHIGSDALRNTVLKNIKQYLTQNGVSIRLECEILGVSKNENGLWTVAFKSGSSEEVNETFEKVVLAVGREGSKWLQNVLVKNNLPIMQNPVDIGVRVEIPHSIAEKITDEFHNMKFVYHTDTFDDQVRTFCCCPKGFVTTETYDGLVLVNGFSNSSHGEKSDNTNFAILVTVDFTKPFNQPVEYARNIATLSNYLGDPVLVQRLGDLRAGKRSTPERIKRSTVKPTLKTATPGDLSFVLPHRILTDILEMLEALDKVVPGVNSKHTLLYGVETKFYSIRTPLSEHFQAKTHGLYIIGDGSGTCRGISHSAISGKMAAADIVVEYKNT